MWYFCFCLFVLFLCLFSLFLFHMCARVCLFFFFFLCLFLLCMIFIKGGINQKTFTWCELDTLFVNFYSRIICKINYYYDQSKHWLYNQSKLVESTFFKLLVPKSFIHFHRSGNLDLDSIIHHILQVHTWNQTHYLCLAASIKNCMENMVKFTHYSHIVIQNNIMFSFLIIKVTKCWNSHVDWVNNNKCKCTETLHHVSERLRQN